MPHTDTHIELVEKEALELEEYRRVMVENMFILANHDREMQLRRNIRISDRLYRERREREEDF